MLFRWDQSLSVKLLLPWAYRYIKNTLCPVIPWAKQHQKWAASGSSWVAGMILEETLKGWMLKTQALKSRRRRKEELRCTESWLSAVLPIRKLCWQLGQCCSVPLLGLYAAQLGQTRVAPLEDIPKEFKTVLCKMSHYLSASRSCQLTSILLSPGRLQIKGNLQVSRCKKSYKETDLRSLHEVTWVWPFLSRQSKKVYLAAPWAAAPCDIALVCVGHHKKNYLWICYSGAAIPGPRGRSDGNWPQDPVENKSLFNMTVWTSFNMPGSLQWGCELMERSEWESLKMTNYHLDERGGSASANRG